MYASLTKQLHTGEGVYIYGWIPKTFFSDHIKKYLVSYSGDKTIVKNSSVVARLILFKVKSEREKCLTTFNRIKILGLRMEPLTPL